MSGNKDLKEDIQNCFKLIAKIDAKYDARIDELKDKQNDYSTDVKLLSKGLDQIVNGLGEHIAQFQRHNDEEMLNYKEIQKLQEVTRGALVDLKNSVDKEIQLNETRDERMNKQDENINNIQKTQRKFLMWSAYIIGGGTAIISLLKLGVISVNIG